MAVCFTEPFTVRAAINDARTSTFGSGENVRYDRKDRSIRVWKADFSGLCIGDRTFDGNADSGESRDSSISEMDSRETIIA